MVDNNTKRCPRCGGEIDYFGSCRKCGREWSEHLEEDEQAEGLPEGEQHPAVKKVATRKPRKSRYTKTKGAKPPIPWKYADWMIDDGDDETEIIRKRSLMRLDAKRTYSALGLVSRAHESQKGVLLWLGHLAEFLDDNERKVLAPTIGLLKRAFTNLTEIRQAKAVETARIELALEKAHKSARRVRLRMMDEAKRKLSAKRIVPGRDTEGFSTPEPVALDLKLLEDPKLLAKLTKEELLELAKEKLANLDQEKALRRKPFDPDENE